MTRDGEKNCVSRENISCNEYPFDGKKDIKDDLNTKAV